MASTKSITIEINGDAKDFTVSVKDAEDALGDLEGASEGAGKGFSGMGEKLKGFASQASAVFAGAALLEGAKALGSKLVDAFSEAMDVEKGQDRLAAQLGLSPEQSAEMGRIAGRLYSQAYGESLGDVNEALRAVQANIGQGIGTAGLEEVTAQALNLADAFGEDVAPMARAAGIMVKSGLANEASEAFDILTVGFQNGANAGEDLLDTFSEYSGLFADLGISGPKAMGLISQALRAGARDSDFVADAIKEFGIRSKDASDTSIAAFQALGLNGQQMTKIFAAGGEEADKAMSTVIQRLKDMKDPVAQNATAVALFGTKAEDLGSALFALDPTTAVASLGEVTNAADRMGQTLGDNAATKLEAFKRSMHMGLVTFMKDNVLPGVVEVGERLLGFFRKVQDAGKVFYSAFTGEGVDVRSDIAGWVGPIKDVATWLRDLADQYLPPLQEAWGQMTDRARAFTDWIAANENTLVTLGIIVGGVLVAGVISLTVALWNMAAAVIAATWPVLAVVAGLWLMVAAVRWAWENWGFFREAVQGAMSWLQENVPPILEAVRAAIDVAVQWIVGVAVPWLQGAFGSFVGFLQNTLLPAVMTVWGWVQTATANAVAFIAPIISFLVEFVSQNFGHLLEIVRNVWDWIINTITNAWQIVSNMFQFWLNIISGNWGAAWQNLVNVGAAAWDWIRNTVANGVGVVRELLQGLAAWIGSIGGRLFEGILVGFKAVINSVIDKWNSLSFSVPSIDIFGIKAGGQTLSVPRIPRFASGGVFRAPGGLQSGLAVLHDGERVVPRAMVGLSSAGLGGQPIHLHFQYGLVGNEDAIGRAVMRAAAEAQRRGFRAPAVV